MERIYDNYYLDDDMSNRIKNEIKKDMTEWGYTLWMGNMKVAINSTQTNNTDSSEVGFFFENEFKAKVCNNQYFELMSNAAKKANVKFSKTKVYYFNGAKYVDLEAKKNESKL